MQAEHSRNGYLLIQANTKLFKTLLISKRITAGPPIESASLQINTEPKEGASVFTYQSSNALGFGFENKTIYLSFSQISAKDVVISELIVKPANAPRENAVCYYTSHYELKLNGQTETSMRGYIQYGKTEKGASIKFGIGKENGPQIELSFQKAN